MAGKVKRCCLRPRRNRSCNGPVFRAGRVEQSNCGTIYLSEIEALSLSMQAKVLRLVQLGQFELEGMGLTDPLAGSDARDPDALRAEGRAWSIDEAVAYALSNV